MRCGLFGKLGTKRDYIALATPHDFLRIWEPWVQACMSASRHQLAAEWQSAFLTAPVWRFWLGADICGATVLGAIMPSVDGVGRYYPLTLLAMADPSYSIPPPDLNIQADWFAAAEGLLLSTLDQANSFESISTALDVMPVPIAEPEVGTTTGTIAIGKTMLGIVISGGAFQDSLLALRQGNHGASAAATFWWTEGGRDFSPMALCSRGMPDPFRYSIMLTGALVSDEIESA
ncbi:type VI secretion system-associated protein TagF [Bradyrhizobium sp. JYMT SZCCT0428]|uniref:type VI secretion system-associated protein TagF n=1 Tax=Bradyrhizobium sp. JYMT SZCCT0428 TaxID=2807673 RepID=UPI001BA6558E|nr:type VI secretion system-associated protein TagF [Bradyrhizobium sp. JYMT SZCCT0428]MBR1155205.1 type VI secretion system-associated protein TagF [Bradyrhizobium sp. JYMT SZCCT0428]